MAKLIIDYPAQRFEFDIDEEIIEYTMSDGDQSRDEVIAEMQDDPIAYFDAWISDTNPEFNVTVIDSEEIK